MKITLSANPFLRFAAILSAAVALFNPSARAASAPRPPTIYAFNVAAEATINLGTTTELNWSVGDATSLSLAPDIGDVSGTTSVQITPTVTTTYVLTAKNAAGSVTKSRKITVIVPPVIGAFTASPPSINAGAPATLAWSAPGATYYTLVADNDVDPGQLFTTSTVVRPKTTTTYTLTAHNTAGTAVKTVTLPVAAPLPKPVIASFTASPASIAPGDSATLGWSVTGATSLAITPGPGVVTGTSVSVSPTATTTYTLTATNSSGSVTKKTAVTVTVAPPAPPVINSFSTAPGVILRGESTTMTWSVTGATSLSISPGIGAVTGTSFTFQPTASGTYTLSATNAGGTVTKTTSIVVNDPVPLPVISSFTASVSPISLGGSSTLSWAVSGATSLSVSANLGTGPGPVTGTSVSVSPTGTTLYTLTATNVTGSVTKSVEVVVNTPVPLPVISSFTASPGTITSGSTTLSWAVTGATTVSIQANVGANPGTVTGTSFSVSPTATTVYTLTATNATGNVTKTTTVTVNAPPPGIAIESLTATPDNVIAGEAVTLSWVVTGADSLWMSSTLGGDVGSMNGRTSVVVYPLGTTRYALTAFSSQFGTVAKSVTVTVGPPPPPPVPVIASFGASPSTIAIGGSTTLNWSVSAADSVSIAASAGASPGAVTGTSVGVSPAADTTYTLTATNTFGSVTRTATVTVTGPTAPVIGSFTATPAFIQAGESSRLDWAVSGADTIAIAADVGASPGPVTGTSLTVTPAATTTYTLTATNTIGSTTAVVPVTIFTPGNGSVVHPRIWITPASLPALRQRAVANDAAWLKLRDDCDAYVTMPIAFPDQDPSGGTINGGYQYLDYLQPATALGLGYQIAKTVDPVRAARYAAKEKQLLLALSDPIHHGRPTTDSGYSIRAYVPALALGYDWIHETLSDSDRAQIFTEINRWVASFDQVGFGRNFPNGNYFAGYYCAKPLGALATEGENPNAAAMWNDWLNRIHYGMVQPYHAQWLSGGGAPDGWNYGPFEVINMLRPIAAAFTAKGLDLIHDTAQPFTFPDGHARWMGHFTWPDLKTVSDRGFVYEGTIPTPASSGWATQYNGLLRFANGDNAPLMQQYTLDLRARAGSDPAESWAEFLFHDNAAPKADYRTSLSYRTVGDGQVAMRSSWATDAVWGAFQSGPFTGFPDSAEEFTDQGSLAIQRGGVQFLVNTWGALMRHTPGTDDGNTVFNPLYNELFGDQTDGVHAGRRIFNTYYAPRAQGYWGQIGNGPGSTTTLSRFEDGGGYVLMRGTHLEDQYWAPHPITGWTRNIVYVRPQLFVVYDRTTVNNAGTDNWMAWHVAASPVEQTGAAAGTHRYDVVDTRAAFGGNLFRGRVSTVLPAGNAVTSTDVFGRGKVYRLEVRNGAPAAAATWLTVFDAAASSATAGTAAPLSAAAGNVLVGGVEGTLVTTATGNVAVLFSKSGSAVSGAVSIALPAIATSCVVADLAPGTGYAVTAQLADGGMTLQIAPGGTFTTTAQGTLAVNVSVAGVVTAP